MHWYAYGYVECRDDTYESTYWIDTLIYRSGVGFVAQDYSPRDTPSDYTKYGSFSDVRESRYNEILPMGAPDNPRDYINDCYSHTFIGGAPSAILGGQSSPSDGGASATTQLPEYW